MAQRVLEEMIPFVPAKSDPWAERSVTETESFWASYSDLMAGVLMVFALTTAMTLLSIGKRFVEPTEKVTKWKQVVEELANDEELNGMEGVKVNPDTGALVIASDSLRFGFNNTSLGEEGKALLREVVPRYLEKVRERPDLEEHIEMIEVGGHTDRKDKGNANPWVSRGRAGAVLDFLLSEPSMEGHQQFLKARAVTTGYADTKFPQECAEDECAKARRVEITVRLRDSEVLGEFIRLLEQIIQQ
jgi:outer membrane protein OmpA-like peptidoglycan-associated protein